MLLLLVKNWRVGIDSINQHSTVHIWYRIYNFGQYLWRVSLQRSFPEKLSRPDKRSVKTIEKFKNIGNPLLAGIPFAICTEMGFLKVNINQQGGWQFFLTIFASSKHKKLLNRPWKNRRMQEMTFWHQIEHMDWFGSAQCLADIKWIAKTGETGSISSPLSH